MTATKGKDVYIMDGTGTGAVAIVGLRSTTITIDGETVDVTSRDDAGWRKLLAGAGIAKVSVKGEGIVDDGTQIDTLRARTIAQSLDAYTLVFGNGDKMAGAFQLAQFEQKGEYKGEQTASFSFESSGALTTTLV